MPENTAPSDGGAGVLSSAAGQAVFLVDSSRVEISEAISASVRLNGGEASAYDFVALIKDSAPEDSQDWYTWQWSKGEKLSFASPGYGQWSLRYLRKNSAGEYVCLGRSACVTVGPEVDISLDDDWTVIVNSEQELPASAWVGLFRDDQSDNYVEYHYVKKGVPIAFKPPATNGLYHVRFYCQRYNGPNARSRSVPVTKQDEVRLQEDGTRLKIHVSVASANPAEERVWVWVGFANEPRSGYYRRYKYVTEPTQTFDVKKMIHAGEYEARIYKGSSNILVKSQKLVITLD